MVLTMSLPPGPRVAAAEGRRVTRMFGHRSHDPPIDRPTATVRLFFPTSLAVFLGGGGSDASNLCCVTRRLPLVLARSHSRGLLRLVYFGSVESSQMIGGGRRNELTTHAHERIVSFSARDKENRRGEDRHNPTELFVAKQPKNAYLTSASSPPDLLRITAPLSC